LVHKLERVSQPGPVIRDLTVPERERPLRPARLGRIRQKTRFPARLYETVLAAWTLGLALATLGLVEAGWFHPGSVDGTTAVARPGTDPVLPPVAPALPPKTDEFRENARL
jgi:hypothetical protein